MSDDGEVGWLVGGRAAEPATLSLSPAVVVRRMDEPRLTCRA
jgi:hypothetical protein